MNCPICKSFYISDFPDYDTYKVCLNCNLYLQDPLPPKIFEGPGENEGRGPDTGHLMSDHDKEINTNLARALYQMFYPNTVMDIGSKYPYFLSILKNKAEVLGIDSIPDIIEYGKELEVPVINADFEVMDVLSCQNKYDLITLIHTFEHFYDPIKVMEKLIFCLSDRGIIYIRMPNMDVPGIERDFTEHHSKIHPYIYSTQAVYILLEKLGCEIFRIDNMEPGQSDYYIRKRKEKYTLSVCMIVKDEEKNVTDCLESIKDIADEIIIVDTGSKDKTKEVVSKYTDKIFDFQWIDDFSAARNYSLSKAISDWVLWVDADDVVETPEKILPLLNEPFSLCNFNIVYGNDVFRQPRLFRNFMNIQFAGRVHEYPSFTGMDCKEKSDVIVRHKTEKHSTEDRSQRNLRILNKALEDDSNNTRTMFYLANTLKELGQYDNAIDMYRKYLGKSVFKDERWMAQKYIGNILMWNKKYEEAIKEFKNAIEIDDRWAESYYYMGECYYFLKDYKICIELMEKAYRKKLPDSSFWKELSIYNEAPLRYLFACYEKLGEMRYARAYCRLASKKKPDDEWLRNRVVYYDDIIKKKVRIVECYRQGALGDCLMTTAALRGLKQKYPGSHIRYVTHPHSMQILEGNKFIDELTVEIKEDTPEKIYFAYPDKDSRINEGYPHKPLTRHLIQIFNECAGVPDNTMEMECTLSEREEELGEHFKWKYKKYATLHAKGGWSPYKNWYNDRWEAVVEELFKKGIVTVQIAHSDDPLIKGTIDFRGNSVKSAIAVIKYASFHMGVDSFSNHASSAVKTPAVILFGSTSPIGSGYEQNVNIYKSLTCQPCYKEHAWSKDHNNPCPYDKKCMDLITVEEVIARVFELSGIH